MSSRYGCATKTLTFVSDMITGLLSCLYRAYLLCHL